MPATAPTGRRLTWQTLCSQTLPSLARSKDPAQPRWPVTLDHCFGRIILDNVVGGGQSPWTEKLKSPAIKNMSDSQIEKCIELGEKIASGKADLVGLDEASLRVRGKESKVEKSKGEKRKRGEEGLKGEGVEGKKSGKGESGKKRKSGDGTKQVELNFKSSSQDQSQQSNTAKHSDHDHDRDQVLAQQAQQTTSLAEECRIIESSGLADYRKKVLLLLCQVPKGKYTTYAAMSKFLKSSPRAMGNAMRNNPFAPAVPCHRVLAADGKIGGYGGQWGDGELVTEKRKLLREEGLRFDGKGKVVGGPWRGFK